MEEGTLTINDPYVLKVLRVVGEGSYTKRDIAKMLGRVYPPRKIPDGDGGFKVIAPEDSSGEKLQPALDFLCEAGYLFLREPDSKYTRTAFGTTKKRIKKQ